MCVCVCVDFDTLRLDASIPSAESVRTLRKQPCKLNRKVDSSPPQPQQEPQKLNPTHRLQCLLNPLNALGYGVGLRVQDAALVA